MNCVRASGSSATSKTGRTFSRSPRRNSVAAAPAPLAVRDTLRRAQLRWRRCGRDLAKLLDHGGRAARRDDRVEHVELLGRGDGEQAGQPGDVVPGVVGHAHWRRRAAGRRSPGHPRSGAPGPRQVDRESAAALAEQRAGTRRWTRPVARPRTSGPPRSTTPRRTRGRRRPEPAPRETAAAGAAFVIPQQAAEPLREPGCRADEATGESARRRSPCP